MKDSKFSYEDIINIVSSCRKAGLEVAFVEPNQEKGFNYPYIMCIPKDCGNTMVVDCLNHCEEALPKGKIENVKATQAIYELFEEYRIPSDTEQNVDIKQEDQEEYEESYQRLGQRIAKAMNTLGINTFKLFNNKAPTMVPIIPEYNNTEHEMLPQELGAGVVSSLGSQVKAMIKDAQRMANLKTNKKLNDKIFMYGHSQSSTFANHFSTVFPEMIAGLELGGDSYFALPIDEIKLEIVEQKKENEGFRVKNGVPIKAVTAQEFREIYQDYKKNKKPHQRDIVVDNNGVYTLPMNFPVGLADIEHYVDMENFKGGKEEFKKQFSDIKRMFFIGENEEAVEGHFAYDDGELLTGEKYKAGDDLDRIVPGKTAKDFPEAEKASMHNRVMDYIAANRVLFGKSKDEKWKTYIDLCEKLGLSVQSKIYKDVGHIDIWNSEEFLEDSTKFYGGIVEEKEIVLAEGAKMVNPKFQAERKAKAEKAFFNKNKNVKDNDSSDGPEV